MTRAERLRAAAARLEVLLNDTPSGVDPRLARIVNDPAPGSLLDGAFVMQGATAPLSLLLSERADDVCEDPGCSACGRLEQVAAGVLASEVRPS